MVASTHARFSLAPSPVMISMTLWALGLATLCGPVSPGFAQAAAPSPAPAFAPQSAAPASANVPPSQAAVEEEEMDEAPPIRMEPPMLDFGIVAPGASSRGVVKLINTGTKELEILTVQPGCKCTTINDIAGQKIPPGGFVELNTEMKAQSSPGSKSAEIKILIDGYAQVLKLAMRNEVSLPVRVSPAYMNVVKGQPLTGRIVVESIDKQPFKICSIGGKKPNLVGFDIETDAPRNQYLVDWDFNRDFETGIAPRYWIIETDRADCPLVDIFVRHESSMPRPVLKLTEYRHTFGRVEEGTPFEFTIDINDLPEAERVITAASASSAGKVELVSTTVEGSLTHVNLKLIPAPGTLGVQFIPFSIYTNAREQKVAVWGQFVPKGTVGCFGR